MACCNPFNCCAFVIVSGANRGYGLAMVEQLVKKLMKGSVVIITARNLEGLKEAEAKLRMQKCHEDLIIKPVLSDLSKTEDVTTFMAKCIDGIDMTTFQCSMIIHNASSLGNVKLRIHEYMDQKILSDYMTFNVSNVAFVTAEFLASVSKKCKSIFVVNISSLCAIEPFASCGLYCSAKAARDMLFKVLAVERKDIRVLNWAPGPMPTRMMSSMMGSCDATVADFFKRMSTEKSYVPCDASASKLMTVLENNSFTSGAHLDYYDDLGSEQ